MTNWLLRGLAAGFVIAAPVGAIGVLCIRRTLEGGLSRGFASGLGAASADACYGAIAGSGLTAVSGLLLGLEAPLRGVGGLFLVWLGVRTFFSRPGAGVSRTEPAGLAGAWASTFGLTLANPSTILAFGAVFAGLGLVAHPGGTGAAAALTVGVFVGSATWWLLLTTAVSVVRGRMDDRALVALDRISGSVITVFGVVALASLFVK